MANLQVKGVDDAFYETLKQLAKREGRSLSQQVTFMLKEFVAKREKVAGIKKPGELLLDLAGSWEDERSPQEIVEEVQKARRSSAKLKDGFDVSS